MAFLDELKKIARPFNDDEDDFIESEEYDEEEGFTEAVSYTHLTLPTNDRV